MAGSARPAPGFRTRLGRLYLRENPWHNRRRCSKDEWHDKALQQGMVAVNSILRDWVKGQIMAVETGLTEFRHVFVPSTLMLDQVVQHLRLLDAALELLRSGHPRPAAAHPADQGRAHRNPPYMVTASGETVAELIDRRGGELIELPE